MERSNQSSTVKGHTIAAPIVMEPFLKRPLDVMRSTFMLILSLPVSLPIALAIKLEDGGPIFYRQERWWEASTRHTAQGYSSKRNKAGSRESAPWVIKKKVIGYPFLEGMGKENLRVLKALRIWNAGRGFLD